jgi:aryl-alcohol dehydrogenase-like predicted oxidoreductase
MRYTTLPNTQLRPSVLCFGTADIGSKIDRAASFRLLDAYAAQGGNFLDSAEVYANWLPIERSISETTIGQWVAARGNRDQMILATKGAHPRLESMHLARMSRAEISSDIEESRQRLQTDTIDLYWLHRDAPHVPIAVIIDTLNEQVQAGKIRHFGCSNWQTERIREAQAYAAQQAVQGFVANQPLWNIGVIDPAALSDPTMVLLDQPMWAYHQQTQLAAIPYSSQANGLFNKLAAGKTDAIKPNTRRIYHQPENQQRLQRIQQLAAETGLTITQIVLGYLLAQPFPTIPIVGCQNLEQLQDSLAAGDVRLTAEQARFLEEG